MKGTIEKYDKFITAFQVFVTDIVDVVCYHVQLVEHKDDAGKKTRLDMQAKALAIDITLHFALPTNRMYPFREEHTAGKRSSFSSHYVMKFVQFLDSPSLLFNTWLRLALWVLCKIHRNCLVISIKTCLYGIFFYLLFKLCRMTAHCLPTKTYNTSSTGLASYNLCMFLHILGHWNRLLSVSSKQICTITIIEDWTMLMAF